MRELKCPFCNRNLHKGEDGIYSHLDYMTECKGVLFDGSKELWQELIRTRKELEQSEICCTEWAKQALDYKAENIALSVELELIRKALDVALDWLEQVATLAKCDDDLCREFTKRKLVEIKTALEQKN